MCRFEFVFFFFQRRKGAAKKAPTTRAIADDGTRTVDSPADRIALAEATMLLAEAIALESAEIEADGMELVVPEKG